MSGSTAQGILVLEIVAPVSLQATHKAVRLDGGLVFAMFLSLHLTYDLGPEGVFLKRNCRVQTSLHTPLSLADTRVFTSGGHLAQVPGFCIS